MLNREQTLLSSLEGQNQDERVGAPGKEASTQCKKELLTVSAVEGTSQPLGVLQVMVGDVASMGMLSEAS